MSTYICDRATRESLPYQDFTFKCTDGDVKAHAIILVTRCKTISDMVNANGACSEIKIDYG